MELTTKQIMFFDSHRVEKLKELIQDVTFETNKNKVIVKLNMASYHSVIWFLIILNRLKINPIDICHTQITISKKSKEKIDFILNKSK